MPSEFDFNQDAFNDGSAAFMRGVTLDILFKQLARETKEPEPENEGQWTESPGKRHAEQDQRELIGKSLMLGYINGFIQAVRRIDAQMMLPPQ